MAKKQNTFVSAVMFFIYEGTKILPIPFETPYQWARRTLDSSRPNYYASIFNLEKRGALKIVNKNGQKFIKLTSKGELEVLLSKAEVVRSKKWDGKWRLIIYDIPESSKQKRDLFRKLLKANNFVKLQGSVFISPYELNWQAIEYLKKSGLMAFIRIVRVDVMDNDKELKKKFNLKS